MRRALFWTAVLIALSAMFGGAAYAYVGYRATSGPESVVRGYFAALARSDAPAALAYGAVPDGPRVLLTSEVLAEQQQIAPLHGVRILAVTQAGDEAEVRCSYFLRFAGGDRAFGGTVRLIRRNGAWRLAESAVATTVRLGQAADRVAFATTRVPAGPTLLFPGALPLRLDTPFLQVDRATAAMPITGGEDIDVRLEPTAAARSAFAGALTAKLTSCVSGSKASGSNAAGATAARSNAAAACPLPSSRIVPGSLVGRIVAGLGSAITLRVGSDSAGTISMTGTVLFLGGYRDLDFDNVAHSHVGRLRLRVAALAYPVVPLTVRLQAQQ